MPGEMPEPAPDAEFHEDVDPVDPELTELIAHTEAVIEHSRGASPPIVDLRPTDDGEDPALDFARRPLGYKGKEK